MNCKLFAFDNVNSTWVERGRGTLRVNDMPVGTKTQSRVVMRTVGSLRVVLNTKVLLKDICLFILSFNIEHYKNVTSDYYFQIWCGMSIDKPSSKSVRLTAMDNSGQIKVFLVMVCSSCVYISSTIPCT